ncbi:hypothetical protein ZEAMMB73_Zm00001d038336 [Zea mays]|uniref:DUF668 family protein n=1 Tax=Zea mays TaxID=4577 RepID=A0A1D6M5J9_MAIZE|nr:hypothetical protein ZEAMMB73_Zm00001d038336 [Zea mays]
MGGLCSKVSAVDKSPSDTAFGRNQVTDHDPGASLELEKQPVSGKAAAPAKRLDEQQQQHQSFSFLESVVPGVAFHARANASGETGPRTSPQLTRSLSQRDGVGKAKAGADKVSEVSSILGRASTVGLEKAVEVLDTLGSSMTSFNSSRGFVSSSAAKGNKISMLAFEMANTIVKGSNLMHSLSELSIKHLKEVVLHSELQKVFNTLYPKILMNCSRWQLPTKGDSLDILKQAVKVQSKHVKSMKKKSLWSKNLEEDPAQAASSQASFPIIVFQGLNITFFSQVVVKLVDIVHFLHLEIYNAFGHPDKEEPQERGKHHNRLGPAGLALHYASIINQIDNLVSQSCAMPPNARDALYHSLPPIIKSALRYKLQSFEVKEELTASQVKAEMEKTLWWLVPLASNTNKAYHGFGWVGELANTGSEMNCKLSGQKDMSRIETLYHADKEKTEALILELVVWLHHLISKSRHASGGVRSPIKSPVSSPTQNGAAITLLPGKTKISSPILTQEDQDMLRDVKYRKFVPGISKSQEFDTKSSHSKRSRLSKSNSQSPASGNRK